MKKIVFLWALWVATAGCVYAQAPTVDVMGSHDMGSWGPAPIQGALTTCQYCHSVHSGLDVKPLWSQQLSVQKYTLYTSSTITNVELQPVLGQSSNLCLSCHDGTVAPGSTKPYGTIKMRGSMNAQDLIAPNGSLQGVHPFNFQLPLQAASNLVGSLALSPPSTQSPAVKLINGNVQCNSCHEPHVQGLDSSNMFLVMDNTNSALCLACHLSDPGEISASTMRQLQQHKAEKTPVGGATASATYNAFAYWSTSVHATVNHRVAKAAKLGTHANIRQNGCLSCHTSHNAAASTALLRGPIQAIPNMDATTQNCITCHNGGSNISPAIPNVYAELVKTSGHPYPTGSNVHAPGESAVLNNNRHATCVDCHDAHASTATGTFNLTTIRGAQKGASGVSVTDGTTKTLPAANQYEVCLRCHGTSAGKKVQAVYGYAPTREVTSGDALNLIPQFNVNAKSSHPVMHDRSSALSQPSLLKVMWNLDGHTPGRAMGSRILCSDCHNSDDNREFGGTGPNGPHGSNFSHILERRYEFSQVAPGVAPAAGPGTTIQNLLPPTVDPAGGGPYSLCAKCHDLSNILANNSFNKHSLHITAGFSCSVCHTAHGMSASASGVSGDRMVNFDLGVVAPADQSNLPVSYNRANNTCTLKCHNYNHNANGTVTSATAQRSIGGIKH